MKTERGKWDVDVSNEVQLNSVQFCGLAHAKTEIKGFHNEWPGLENRPLQIPDRDFFIPLQKRREEDNHFSLQFGPYWQGINPLHFFPLILLAPAERGGGRSI